MSDKRNIFSICHVLSALRVMAVVNMLVSYHLKLPEFKKYLNQAVFSFPVIICEPEMIENIPDELVLSFLKNPIHGC